MVAHAQGTVDEAAAHADDLHVGIVIGTVVANLLQAAQGREVTDGVGEHGLAFPGQARRQPRHGLFSDSRVDKLVRVRLPEGLQYPES